MALLLGSCVNDPKIAGALSPLVFLPLILCSGFYSNSNSLPWVTKWIGYVDPFAYAYNGILHDEFNDRYTILDPISLFNPTTDITFSIIYLTIILVVFKFLALVALRLSVVKLKI